MNTQFSDRESDIDVLLVNPPSPIGYRYKVEHLGMGYLAAVLRKKNLRVKIIDAPLMGLSIRETVKEILKTNISIVIGFSVTTPEVFYNVIEILNFLRMAKVSVHTCLGGYFPTFWFKEILEKFKDVNFIVISEGEFTFLELVTALRDGKDIKKVKGIAYRDNGNIILNQPRPLIKDLDELPFPDRDTIRHVIREGYPAIIYSSRGCRYSCTFCQVNSFYRLCPGSRWRARSPINVVNEIEFLNSMWGVKSFLFVDDSFLDTTKESCIRAHEIAAEIIRRKLKIRFAIQCRPDAVEKETFRTLKKAGLYLVFLGIESGIERSLKYLKKGITLSQIRNSVRILNRLGIEINAGFILSDPNTTWEELRENIKFLKEVREAIPLELYTLKLLKGTELENILCKENRLLSNGFYLGFYTNDPKVELFQRIIGDYGRSGLSAEVISKFYKILFSICDSKNLFEEKEKKKRVKIIADSIKDVYLFFLEELTKQIDEGSLKEISSLFNKLSGKFQQISKKLGVFDV